MPDYIDTIVRQFIEKVSTDIQALVEQYIDRFGTRIDTDNARELCSEYKDNKELRPLLAPLIHEPASQIAKAVWNTLLARSFGIPGTVIFLAGGPGSGKSTVVKSRQFAESFRDAIVVYDSTFSSFLSANQKIEDALQSGKDIEIFYIYRNAKDAAYSVILRAVQTGRTVPIQEIVSLHWGAQRTIFQLCDQYRYSEDVMIHLINNSGEPELVDWFENEEALRIIQYSTIIEVRTLVDHGAKKAYDRIQQDQGAFPPIIAQGIFGNEFPF